MFNVGDSIVEGDIDTNSCEGLPAVDHTKMYVLKLKLRAETGKPGTHPRNDHRHDTWMITYISLPMVLRESY